MTEYKYKATNCIAESLQEVELPFYVKEVNKTEVLSVPVSAENSPSIPLMFLSEDNESDVGVRGFHLIANVPENKETEVLRYLNELKRKKRYYSCYLEKDNSITISYDIPVKAGFDALGDMALELIIRVREFLKDEYENLCRVVYGS